MQGQILDHLNQLIDQIESLHLSDDTERASDLYSQLVQTVIMLDDVSRGQLSLDDQIKQLGNQATNLRRAINRDWARRIGTSDESLIVLRQYPYLDDYWLLVNRELTLARLTGLKLDDKSRLLVVGEDVLPLTTCQLLQHTGAHADVVCQYPNDVKLAQAVSNVLGLTLHTSYWSMSDLTDKLNAGYDLIIDNAPMASQKGAGDIELLLNGLRLSGRLIVRTVTGARRLLRPDTSTLAVPHGQLLVEYHPTDNVIESSLIYRKAK